MRYRGQCHIPADIGNEIYLKYADIAVRPDSAEYLNFSRSLSPPQSLLKASQIPEKIKLRAAYYYNGPSNERTNERSA